MEAERIEFLISKRNEMFRTFRSRRLINTGYSPGDDSLVIRTIAALSGPTSTVQLGGSAVYDLSSLSEHEKEMILLMGWSYAYSGNHRCCWCGKTVVSLYQDRQCGIMACSPECMRNELFMCTGMFRNRTALKSFFRKGAKNAKKKSTRVRVRRSDRDGGVPVRAS